MATDQYVPLSHEQSYLFTQFEKVSNFLAFNLKNDLKGVLAKPVQTGYMVDWFSAYPDMVQVMESGGDFALRAISKYRKVCQVISEKRMEFEQSGDEDKRNWANLLAKVFNESNNVIFFNGEDITIVWGWAFENADFFSKSFRSIASQSAPFALPEQEAPGKTSLTEVDFSADSDDNRAPEVEPPYDKFIRKEALPSVDSVDDFETQQISTIGIAEFLRWFAGRFWWILWALTALAAIVFVFKSVAARG